MAVSEERLQLLLSKEQKQAVQQRAQELGVSVGHYVRTLIDEDLKKATPRKVVFPFGVDPIRTGRTHGSVEHNRPET